MLLEEVRLIIIPKNARIKKLKSNHLSIVHSHNAKIDLSERETIIIIGL